MQSPIDRAYQELANGIVAQAANDYRDARNGKRYNNRSCSKIIEEIERFFHSNYFEILTRVKGDYLLEKLKQEPIGKKRSKRRTRNE